LNQSRSASGPDRQNHHRREVRQFLEESLAMFTGRVDLFGHLVSLPRRSDGDGWPGRADAAPGHLRSQPVYEYQPNSGIFHQGIQLG